jgi:hypothetical protein
MKETKAFLKNQNDIYQTEVMNHLKEGKFNILFMNKKFDMIIANTITLMGIEEAHPTRKTKKNGKK